MKNMMTMDTIENNFDYDLNDAEHEDLTQAYSDESSSLLFTQPLKKLSDLHLMFLIHSDIENCNIVMDAIKHLSSPMLTKKDLQSLHLHS